MKIIIGCLIFLTFNLSVGVLIAAQRWKLARDRKNALVPIIEDRRSKL